MVCALGGLFSAICSPEGKNTHTHKTPKEQTMEQKKNSQI